jgi:hypothetical protein
MKVAVCDLQSEVILSCINLHYAVAPERHICTPYRPDTSLIMPREL